MNVNGLYLKNAYRTASAIRAQKAMTTRANLLGEREGERDSQRARDVKRMLSEIKRSPNATQQDGKQSGSILDSMQAYNASLKTQRQQTKNLTTQKKKLKYSFKNISSRILRSKTSTAARQAVSQANREVLRLKREKMSGKYDSDEIDAAITHAKAMERVARKKVKHLEEEEMAKATGGVCADEEIKEDGAKADRAAQLRQPADTGSTEDDADVMMEALEEMLAETGELLQKTEELLSELQDLGEELGAVRKEMDPADLEALKIHHRNKERKEIVKADAEYLKAIFELLEKEKNAGVTDDAARNALQSIGGAATGSSGGASGTIIDVAL